MTLTSWLPPESRAHPALAVRVAQAPRAAGVGPRDKRVGEAAVRDAVESARVRVAARTVAAEGRRAYRPMPESADRSGPLETPALRTGSTAVPDTRSAVRSFARTAPGRPTVVARL